MLDMDALEAEQEVTAGTRVSGRARVSAHRSRVKHVEVLVKIRWLALLTWIVSPSGDFAG